MNFFSTDTKNALQAKEYAQWIAFAPIVFQATKILRDSGILKQVGLARKKGISLDGLVEKTGLSRYGTRVLVEAGLGIGLLTQDKDVYSLTKTGYFILNDELTRINFDFTGDVCYEAMMSLDKSIKTAKPEGLKALGNWSTIYEGLSVLPQPAKDSWFTFDHFYSDSAFTDALPLVLKNQPKKMLDIGGNTGKWSIACVNYLPGISMTIMDLPGQTAMARTNISSLSLSDRIHFHEADVLDPNTVFPTGFDVVWMSQFLDCFSDEEIVSILKKCATAIDDNGYIYILETFWDRQRFEASAFSLQMTSLYFTAIANGNSQMYDSRVFLELVKKAGLVVEEQTDYLGICHTLLRCKKTS